jgi:hypothetical protein
MHRELKVFFFFLEFFKKLWEIYIFKILPRNRQKNDFFINCKKSSQLPTIYERVLNIFLLSYFGYLQIWQNILINYCHLTNITKLGKEKKKITALRTGGCLSLTVFFKFVFFFQKPKLACSLILKLQENWN